MSFTQGINHLGLSVKDLNETRDFFTNILAGKNPDMIRATHVQRYRMDMSV